jgi:hypothetical protein
LRAFGDAFGVCFLLVALHLTPLSAYELKQFFLGVRPHRLLGAITGDPHSPFGLVGACRMRDAFLSLNFLETEFPCCQEEAFEIWFYD